MSSSVEESEAASSVCKASRESSRSLTLYNALARLDLVAGGGGVLRCHIVGADAREGNDRAATARVFDPLLDLLADTAWAEVSLVLVGPNVFATEADAADDVCAVASRGARPALRVRYLSGLYDACDGRLGSAPHLAAAFQGGIWGYESWRPTVSALHDRGVPLVVTSYNEFEAEDDEDALEALDLGLRWEWKPERNAHSSPDEEPRKENPNGPYALFENCFWQCVV
ncbi:hypothetical protein M885DRAFT_612019 [Pelagophyceae sp. CCMP2097]|nr:hypothetical protein M885DRAFT_612019 [Pelagophyceae sp. CCMP2097]